MPEKEVKTPPPPKKFERDFEQFSDYMLAQMERQFLNQALLELNKGTVEKFADAQVGNFAKVFLNLAKKVKRKLLKRFGDDRIEKVVSNILENADKYNQERFYKGIEEKIGINTTELLAKEGLTFKRNALILETAQWAKKLRDETLEAFTAQSLRVMTHGESLQEVIDEFKATAKDRRDKAKFIARNQIANFNSMASKMRAQKLGIKQAEWITSGDERVRRCHQVRNGKRFALDEGLYSSCDGKTLLPGTDYQCRCTYRMIIPEFEDE